MAVVEFLGFETGDSGALFSLGAGASVQGTTVRTGGYALKCAATASSLLIASSTSHVISFAFRIPAIPGATTTAITEQLTGGVSRFQVAVDTGGHLRVGDLGVTLGLTSLSGSIVLAINTWYHVVAAIDLAAGGVVKVWINGVLDIDTTHTNSVTGSPTLSRTFAGAANPNEYFYDDVVVNTGTVAFEPDSKIIVRQGLAGTPNANAWTKNGAATAALCWSDTPFATGTNCTSSTSAQAQTMLIEKFSVVQTGHGTEVVGPLDTIVACKTSVVAKRATSGNPSIRRRVNAANTDTAVAMTASDAYWDDGIWTTTPLLLDSLEAGMVKAADANLTTCEDVWVHVAHRPVALPFDVGGQDADILPVYRPRHAMIGY